MTKEKREIPSPAPTVVMVAGFPPYCQAFAEVLQGAGIECIPLSYQEVTEERLQEIGKKVTCFIVGEPYYDPTARYYDGPQRSEIISLIKEVFPESVIVGDCFKDDPEVYANIRFEISPDEKIQQLREILNCITQTKANQPPLRNSKIVEEVTKA